MKDRLGNDIDKVKGKVKETVGSLTNNEELELKGKLQGVKADLGNKWEDFKDDVEDIKEEVIDKANDLIDKARSKKK